MLTTDSDAFSLTPQYDNAWLWRNQIQENSLNHLTITGKPDNM